jgi:hypothetical protein
MDIVALLIASVALIVSLLALVLVVLIYRELVRDSFANRDMERSASQAAPGANSRGQESSTRVVDASEQPVSSSFCHAPDLAPEVLAPSLGKPPIPKGGFGTRVVKKRGG